MVGTEQQRGRGIFVGYHRSRSRSPSRRREEVEREAGELTPSASEDDDAEFLGEEERQRREEELIQRRRRERKAILEKHRKAEGESAGRTATDATTTRLEEPPERVPLAGDAAAAAVNNDDVPSSEPEHPVTDNSERNLSSAAACTGGGGDDNGDDDMFASGDDDMFGDDEDAPEGGPAEAGGAKGGVEAKLAGPATNAEPEAIRGKGLADDWDDEEGYYNFRVGEVLHSPTRKYEVYSNCGQGVFSTVLRARDHGWQAQQGSEGASDAKPVEYAVKVVRANEVMHKAAEQEINILRKLGGADPEGKRHCIRLLETFEYRNHVCMVFEAMDMNLREVVKKFGREVGINLKAVRTYAYQLLVALKLLRTCGIFHADIKPDNILVNSSHSSVKLCDLGSAMYAGNNELTPYLVSRFYRSPEVVLGLPYSYAMDMWSLGCVVYELFTGKIAFPGNSNNQMLKLMMDLKGGFPKKMLRRGIFVERHFGSDVNMTFFLVETDPVTKQPMRTAINHPKVTRDLYKELEKKAVKTTDRKKLHQFADFLGQMFMLDPDRRITVNNALVHPFIKDST
ncbi:serine/threonine-protein kinase [Chloropicon primus]|uniref:non-specific serine/threonine protein kinase n=1 Tax=Chloropicon primus TaxID=1764295 RepID=A0A5B8MVH1_9CHLO|nr:serine/threonine-protein kinase [Chloropicon primus]UPR02642.1 serine/threonine-protein kinase [Chloropicon primus]|eukprot:QDZ23430.1 serine/threonine-protein kinase [Chloropicon primus]